MKYLILIASLISTLFLLSPNNGIAQSDNSPYSRFGLGDVNTREFNFLENMGSLGASYTDRYFINATNPASYSFLDATAFDIGVNAEYSLLDDGIKQSVWNGNITHISLVFPLQNLINDALERIERDYRVAMGFTLMPYSTVGYNITTEENDPDFGNYLRNFAGNGGSYQFLYGSGIKYKDFSFGAQIGYLFGNIEYQRNVLFSDIENSFDNAFSTSYNLNGFLWNTGFIYSTILNKSKISADNLSVRPKYLNIGIYGNSRTSFNTESIVLNESIQNILGVNVSRDTLLNDTISGSGNLPMVVGLGFNYKVGEKFGIGADFSFTKWTQYRNDAQDDTLEDTYKISIGGFFRPDFKSYNNYLKRIIYRYGAFYKTDPRSIAGQKITDYGVTLGFGLPFTQQRKISHANFGLVVGNRGQNTPITETYFRFSFSFTYNDDEWFIKRKYN